MSAERVTIFLKHNIINQAVNHGADPETILTLGRVLNSRAQEIYETYNPLANPLRTTIFVARCVYACFAKAVSARQIPSSFIEEVLDEQISKQVDRANPRIKEIFLSAEDLTETEKFRMRELIDKILP